MNNINNWKEFEKITVSYLKSKYGDFFELKGESNSNTSDILFRKEYNNFFIEVKMPEAQCGQFVLIPNREEKKFEYSSKNKTKKNNYTNEIINYMNDNFEKFNISSTSGIDINMSNLTFYNWIIEYYKGKNVKFFITQSDKNFIIFPIENFPYYFEVTAKYRMKKSGSTHLASSSKFDLENALKKASIFYEFEGLNITTEEDLDGKKINGESKTYLLRKEGDKLYRVRQLSNTENSNVIFSIKLKDNILEKQRKEDLDKFELFIKY
ncbi:hypothetical protein LDK13_08410 [Fusobacterium animalis]|uniref:hypothetical protein n=1 Tax=Fusobacterium animalis TaxID=76859 RepID=UPI0004023680|nr:hypothetical protein [Fusobacterium animalis]ALF22114.1 hypothetical protein RO08_07300 [Fusobacterium animalis]